MTVNPGVFETSRIRWRNARLFATCPCNLWEKRAYAPTIYELAGPNTVVRWERLRRKMPFTFAWLCKPSIPFDEYDQQMDALLSVIAAKTGLPLYDLREDLPKGEPKD